MNIPSIRDDNVLVLMGKSRKGLDDFVGRGWTFVVSSKKLFVRLIETGENVRMHRISNGRFAYVIMPPGNSPRFANSFTDAYWNVGKGGIFFLHKKQKEVLEEYEHSAWKFNYLSRLYQQKLEGEGRRKHLQMELDTLKKSIKKRDNILASADRARKKLASVLAKSENRGLALTKKQDLLEKIRKYRNTIAEAAEIDLETLEDDKHRAVAISKEIKESQRLTMQQIAHEARIDNSEPAAAFVVLGVHQKEWVVFKKAPLPQRYTVPAAAERAAEIAWYLENGAETREVESPIAMCGPGIGKISDSPTSDEIESIVMSESVMRPADVFEIINAEEDRPPLMPPSSANIVNMLFSGALNGRMQTANGEVLVKGSITKEWQVQGQKRMQMFRQMLCIFHFEDYSISMEVV